MRSACIPNIVVLALIGLVGCGAASGWGPTSHASRAEGRSIELDESSAFGGGGSGTFVGTPADPGPARFALASVAPGATGAATPPGDPPPPDRTDVRDTSGPLLIYTATLHMAVFEVRATQAALVERARSLGGLLAQQTDDRLVVRVPAERFQAFLDGVGDLGDVLHRDVQAQDVGEEFRDVAIRIRNLEVTRQRVEALLSQATTVDQALSIQRELERITSELEALRGRQRYLADRVALSTITFVFQPRPREALEQPEIFRLPFGWLEQLGLSSLLEVQ